MRQALIRHISTPRRLRP